MHKLPHGYAIVQNKYLEEYWSLLCNGRFIFQGSEDECFIAFGLRLSGIDK